jgi:hypothetical protein
MEVRAEHAYLASTAVHCILEVVPDGSDGFLDFCLGLYTPERCRKPERQQQRVESHLDED